MYELRAPSCGSFFEQEGAGTAQKGIYLEKLATLPVLLPPRAEQKMIVAKIDALLGHVDAAQERLTRVPAILTRFRQSVLAAACSVRLTADWREAHLDVEPASKALARICGRPQFQSGVELPEIPAGWDWAALPWLGELNRGKSRHRPRNAVHLFGGPYPFIQTGDVARSD
jgi:type I restriction enzyme, S subunit